MLTCGPQMMLAWAGDLVQDRCAMLAHQYVLDHYFPAFNPRPHRCGIFDIEGSAFPEREDCEGKVRDGYKGERYRDIGSA